LRQQGFLVNTVVLPYNVTTVTLLARYSSYCELFHTQYLPGIVTLGVTLSRRVCVRRTSLGGEGNACIQCCLVLLASRVALELASLLNDSQNFAFWGTGMTGITLGSPTTHKTSFLGELA